MKFAVWYDNESDLRGPTWEGAELIDAKTADDALRQAGGKFTTWGARQVVTADWGHHPDNPSNILA